MQPARSRFSHRHLFALSTFLVPLAILAVLGWSELRRTGATAQAAVFGEGRQFVASAKQAIEQRLERVLPRVLELSRQHLAAHGHVKATIEIARQPGCQALRGMVLLDELANVLEPRLPPASISLALARDVTRGPAKEVSQLQAVDLLLSRDPPELEPAAAILVPLIDRLVEANPPGPNQRWELLECEALARFHLARVQHVQGDLERAQQGFSETLRLAKLSGYPDPSMFGLGMLAELGHAELAGPAERLRLLREIAESRREVGDDGELSTIAHRLAASFSADDEQRFEVDALLQLEECRAATRAFVNADQVAIKPFVARRTRRSTTDTGEGPHDAPSDVERLVSWPVGAEPMLVCIRAATSAEEARCARVALQFDLRALLADVWQQFQQAQLSGTFTLAVHDPDDNALVPPPPSLPDDLAVPIPVESTNDLTLRAYPADPAGFVAQAEASARNRTLLLLALFVSALGGALWSWRSVSRETELAALKIDLVSRVSHELKTPLALVRMYGETLSMGRARDPEQAAEFGGIIAREAERLTALIQRILDFSRQQAGTLSYAPAPLDLGELLRDVVTAYAPHLEARGVIVVDSLPSDIRVHCDANACESAIVNLLENAAKYGPDGEQEHEVDLVLERQGSRAVIEVRDHGRGIPAPERERVFEGFYRASNAGEVRGAGLGLSLVRHFARAHGGDVEALPRAGGGTVMRLVLPLATAMQAGELPSDSKAGPGVPTAP